MKRLMLAVVALAALAPAALAAGRPELTVSPTSVKPGSTFTISAPANEFCAPGETVWVLSNLFRGDTTVSHTYEGAGLYKGTHGVSTTATATGSFSVKLKLKAKLPRGAVPVWALCKGTRIADGVVKIK